jgi:hypothetical protein
MQHEMMTITPDLAARWLENKNLRNRNISLLKVKAYADDMANGRWKATHQNTIAFYKDGVLADGQHRLSAIIMSGNAVEMMVWFGLEPDAAYGIDAHKMRKTDDQIKIAGGHDWIDRNVVAVGRILYARGRMSNQALSPQAVAEFCEAHKEAIIFATHAVDQRFGSAPLRAALAAAWYHEDHSKLEEWAKVLVTGVGEPPNSISVLSLRDRLLADRAGLNRGAMMREYTVKIAMRSIQAYCAGQALTKLYEPKERAYNVPS